MKTIRHLALASVLLLCAATAPAQQTPYSFFFFGWDTTLNGKAIPPFSLNTPAGEKLSAEGLRGKVIVLDFWSTWCGPCRMLTHELDSALKQYYGRDFIMIGVNFRESIKAGDPVAYWKERGYGFPMVLHGDAYGNAVGAGNPVVIVIDQQGIVRGKWAAWAGTRAAEVEGMVWQLMDKPEVTQQAVLDANRNKDYIRALYLYTALIRKDPSQEKILAQEKFSALLHYDEWQAVDFAKEWLVQTDSSENTLATIGDKISQTEGLTPKVNAFGAQAFEELVAKYPDNGKSLIVYDLMGRCYFRSGDKKKAMAYAAKSIEIARADPQMSPVTLDYLDGVLKKYKEDKASAEKKDKQ